MRMIEITKEKFEEFASKSEYDNYCQTSNYGMLMAELGFDYNFIAYTTNDNEILAAGMFLTKKIGRAYSYAYCPRGYIIDYKDEELVKKFTRNLIKYYKKKNVIFLKINPEITIGTIDAKDNYNYKASDNSIILEQLKESGYMKRKENYPFELLEPKLTTIIDLEKYNIDNLDEEEKNKINTALNNGLEIEKTDSKNIETLYEYIKDIDDRSLNFYRNIYNLFNKTEEADILLVKVNYEKYLLNAKKRAEDEQIRNDKLNEKLRNNQDETNIEEKMKSDSLLEQYKADVIYATKGLKKKEDTIIAGAIVIKHNNKVTVYVAGIDENYSYIYPYQFLYQSIIDMYKNEYKYLDLNGIANDFNSDSNYESYNNSKIIFNPIITEYIGELDLIISKWKFKIVEKNNMLSNEFTKKKDVTK